MTPEEFRVAGHALIDWIADHRTRVPDLPVQAAVKPGEVRAALPDSPPDSPEPFADLLADLNQIVVPGVTQTQHPAFFGWFPSNATLSSVLGDIATGGVAALGITWQSAPALTEVEQVVVDWLRQLCGLTDQWHGAIQDTASTACLVAMLAARERASDFAQNRGGLSGEPAALTVYTSPQAHSSVQKGALLAGFGAQNLRFVEVDPVTYAMRPDALEQALADDVAAGRKPAMVVVALGTTGTTAFDPLAELAPIARKYGAWVHVDAAMAGSAMLLPECRELFAGIEEADSLSWNPHKWLGTVLDCALLYVREPQHLVRVMSTNPSYLQSTADDEVLQYKDWGIPLGRRFRALKLWFQLRLDGVEAIQTRLRRDLANARWLAEQVAAEPGWEVVAPVTLQTVCVRHTPDSAGSRLVGGAEEAGPAEGVPKVGGAELAQPPIDQKVVDQHNLAWAGAINNSGRAFVTPSLLVGPGSAGGQDPGRWMVRISIGVESTERADVAALWELMKAHVKQG